MDGSRKSFAPRVPLQEPPPFGNPFVRKSDFFEVEGYKRMAIQILILSLDELMCDPATGRSGPERAEMARAKEAAVPWFHSDSFEFFALAVAPSQPIVKFRQQCLEHPQLVKEELERLQASQERRKGDVDNAIHVLNLPINSWPFEQAAALPIPS